MRKSWSLTFLHSWKVTQIFGTKILLHLFGCLWRFINPFYVPWKEEKTQILWMHKMVLFIIFYKRYLHSSSTCSLCLIRWIMAAIVPACLVPAVQGMAIFWHGVRPVLLSTNTFDTDGIVGRAVPSLEAAKSCRSLLKGMTRFPARQPPPVVGPCDREASSLHRFPGLFSWHFWRYASW